MILVTGGTGLVGSHLIYELLKCNEPVRALVRNRDKINGVEKVFGYYSDEPESLISRVEWVDGDMLDLCSLEEAFTNVRKVYHCAAIVTFEGKDKAQLIKANVQGTENMVNLCLDHKIDKLCHVSSIASLGKALNGELIDENMKWNSSKNHSAYAVSKYKSEMEVWRGVQEGLNAVIVNPSVILGPGFWDSGSGSLFTKAAKGMKYFTTGTTGFVDVKDVVDTMIQLMECDITAERFILNAENLKYQEFFDMLADAMQIEKPKREATKKLLKIAMFLDAVASNLGIKKREITKEVVQVSLSISKYSNEKVKYKIGKTFMPIKTSIGEIAKKFKNELTIH